jgi:hypothetical protein
MNNKNIRIIDNIGFNFTVNNDIYKITGPIKGFDLLDNSHIGYVIPYIAKNATQNLYEVGLAEILVEDKNICVKKLKVTKSSNKNLPINFPQDNNQLYVFANESIFNSLSNNIVYIADNKHLDPQSAIYLCDVDLNDLTVTLPQLTEYDNIVLEFQIIKGYNSLVIKTHDYHNYLVIDQNTPYIKLVYNNQTWEQINRSNNTVSALNVEPDHISILSDPSGENYSLQYKVNSDFDGANVYWDTTNSGLLFGSDSSLYAKNIISTTGNYNTYFNKTLDSSSFIAYGADSLDRNLYFHPSGRLGINIPSGSEPSTVFHIINTACKQGIRLENRTACTGANITLFHKPSADIQANDTISIISFNAKNSLGNEKIYGNIIAKAQSPINAAETGIIELSAVSGSSMITSLRCGPSSSTLGYTNTSIVLNNNSSITLSNNNNNILIDDNQIRLNSNSIVTTGTISATNIQTQNLILPNISENTLLTVDDDGNIIASTLSAVSGGTIRLSLPENKILSVGSGGSITGLRSLDDYFLTENDIVWSKYSAQSGSICGRQLTFSVAPPQTEFVIGDQIVVIYSGNNYYRKILDIITTNNTVTELLIDQNIEDATGTINVDTYSISRGGYLKIAKSTDDGIVSDATSNIISIQPEQSTIFNTNNKDINFEVYGLDEQPALLVKANTGRNFSPSGIYDAFASQENHTFPIVVTTGGNGISNRYSSANYAYDISRNLFSGILSNVGTNGSASHYGTYDQNGNAAEWVEKPAVYEFRDIEEYVAGGSIYTVIDNTIESSGLKSLRSLARSGCYEDVGFRVASLYGITDNNIINNTLDMDFVNVTNPDNLSDPNDIYLEQRVGGSTTYSAISIPKLGHVTNNYRISTYEVTNSQYCEFLNAVATVNPRGLYNEDMAVEDTGGILKFSGGESYDYTVKPYMENVPVVFVSYISVIRFINWLHNGAPISVSEDNVDITINSGAYYVLDIDGSYIIQKNSYRKYWLPNLNEWHKAAYYQPVEANNYNGTSSVSIKTSEPYLVASGVDTTTELPTQVFANLTVSGWLYVDHIIVGDQTVASPLSYANVSNPPPTTNVQTDVTTAPPATIIDYINDAGTSITRTELACVGDTCNYDGKPLRLGEDTITLCDNEDNVPWWCDTNNSGPGWFI